MIVNNLHNPNVIAGIVNLSKNWDITTLAWIGTVEYAIFVKYAVARYEKCEVMS
eukprot:TRINITY_DN9721_c0_g1_i1.p2 TRINITY_DN9721_c0_g1~~TRINITY_DN9721_c0_g1_i1.p2  ORF type:complete len:54 (+),score=3.22 TRINITY_DN9721_c0_g1_i1:103-264(+)